MLPKHFDAMKQVSAKSTGFHLPFYLSIILMHGWLALLINSLVISLIHVT